MKVVSHHRSHREIVEHHNHVHVNGVAFQRGDRGLPTAHGVGERELESFVGVDGFSFFHDDGQYIGPSLKTGQLTVQPSADLAAAEGEARAHRTIEQMIADGTLTPEIIAALTERAPIVQAAPLALPPEAAPAATEPEPEPEPEAVTPEPEVTEPEAAPEVTPEPEATPEAAPEPDGGPEVDLTDPEALLTLPRPEFLGLASKYKIRNIGVARETVAASIAAAIQAERTPEPTETPAE